MAPVANHQHQRGQRAELQPDRRPIGDRKKRPVPIFPSSLAEHDDYYFQKIHAHPADPPPPEPVLPPPKRHKSLPEQGSSGKAPDKSNWVLPEPLAKKGSRPPIFANHRQEICETLQYFRSYHAGLYKRQGTAYGCLLDGYSVNGDIFADNGKVIITHAGGGSVPISTSKARTRVTPDGTSRRRRMCLGQSESRGSDTVKSLFNCLEHSIPLVLIAGKDYTYMPFLKSKYGVAYAVMGFYLVTHGWAERDGKTQDLIRFKFRFQWVSSQGEPWWVGDMEGGRPGIPPSNGVTPTPSELATNYIKIPKSECTLKHACPYCGIRSHRIYRIKRLCLNEKCAQFFQKLNRNHHPIVETEWRYADWVLISQDSLETEKRVPYQLIPNQVLKDLSKGHTIDSTLMGVYCADCGRLSCRIFWGLFKCETCAKTHEFTNEQLKSVFLQSLTPPDARINDWCSKTSGIKYHFINRVQGWNVIVYYLPRGGGTVIHARRHAGNFDSVDRLLEGYLYNSGGEAFRRNKLKATRALGMVGQQFTLNCGAPYRFSTASTTVNWANSPEVVVAARDEIYRAVRALVQDPLCRTASDIIFNQILSCGYVAGSGMKYHSDDENGVGPVVVSLSLGSSAVMNFRPVERKNKPGGSAPIMGAHADVAGRLDSEENLDDQVAREREAPRRHLNRSCLTLQLLHGDLVIQSGKEIQRDWQHSIKVNGLRIGVTARHLTT